MEIYSFPFRTCCLKWITTNFLEAWSTKNNRSEDCFGLHIYVFWSSEACLVLKVKFQRWHRALFWEHCGLLRDTFGQSMIIQGISVKFRNYMSNFLTGCWFVPPQWRALSATHCYSFTPTALHFTSVSRPKYMPLIFSFMPLRSPSGFNLP